MVVSPAVPLPVVAPFTPPVPNRFPPEGPGHPATTSATATPKSMHSPVWSFINASPQSSTPSDATVFDDTRKAALRRARARRSAAPVDRAHVATQRGRHLG